MSTVKTNNVQIGQSLTATNNFTWYQPSTPDGTVRLGNGNSGSVTDLVTLTSAGNLGIGTSSPGTKVDIGSGTFRIKNATGDTSGLLIYQAASDTSTIFNYYSGPLVFGTGNAEKMRLDSSGNLGLGVTPSAWSSFKAYQVNRASVASTGADTYFSHNWYWSGSADTYIASDYATRYSQQSGQHRWWTAPSGTAGNAISFTQAMTLDASGNLLVGTTSSINGEKLSVRGGYGILCKTQYAISSTATTIAIASGCLLLLRDDANGQTALVMYENAGVPIIISQSGSSYTTGTPTGTQIKVQNRSGNVGVAAVMASGQSTTLNVCVLAVDEA